MLATVVLLLAVPLLVRQARLNAARERVAKLWSEEGPADEVRESPTAATPLASPAPFEAGTWGVVVAGPGSVSVVASAEEALRAAPAAAGESEPVVFRATPPPPAGARLTIAVADGGVRVTAFDLPPPAGDLESALLPPRGLVAEALEGQVLPARGAARGALVAAAITLVRGDLATAESVLSRAGSGPGAKALAGLLACLRSDLKAAHASVEGLASDRQVAPLGKFVTGTALLLDGNLVEARRDFDSAIAARPKDVASALLRALAIERMGLSEAETSAAYEAVLAIAPAHPLARLASAASRAATDRVGALAALSSIAEDLPDWPAPFRLLADVRAAGSSEEDARLAADALERAASLAPEDARGWTTLGDARAALAERVGGEEPWVAAAEAYGKAAERSKEPGLPWFNRAASLEQGALSSPPSPDPQAFFERLVEARSCYAKAVTAGLPATHRAALLHNVGLILEFLPGGPDAGRVPEGLPTSPGSAFEAALAADPAYAPAKAALFAALVAEGDGRNALQRLGTLAAALDPGERAVLEAAARWATGDLAGARLALSRLVPAAPSEADPLPTLARALLDLDYRRAALALLAKEEKVPARIYVRARVHAGLRDPAGVRADLALLDRLDPKMAADAREGDFGIRASLGLEVAVTGVPDDRAPRPKATSTRR